MMPDNKKMTESDFISSGEDIYIHEDFDMMGDDMNPMHQMHHNRILDTLQHCEATCEDMTTMILRRMDIQRRVRQLELLRDCADICSFTSKYIARDSRFAKYTANLCAYICEICGNECLRHRDAESQRCGRICLNCARECKAFAMM